jgi:acetyl-CoA carboxylase carboxyltransferase component
VDEQYRNGEAMNMAATLEIDAVIDPATTRDWLVNGLASASRMGAGQAGQRDHRFVDTW